MENRTMKKTYQKPKSREIAVGWTENILLGSDGLVKYKFEGYELKADNVESKDLILKYGGLGDPGTARAPKRLGWDDLDD